MDQLLKGSVLRIADWSEEPSIQQRSRSKWENGDYVVGRITRRPHHEANLEAPSGRTIQPMEGERIAGALGRRRATRGIVGSWENIDGPDDVMHVIGGGGVIGQVSSISPYLHSPIELTYEGHLHVAGHSVNMLDEINLPDHPPFETPVILVLGTSMSTGKTMTAKVVIRALLELGIEPTACKLSGSGRFHDIMTMKDAGAGEVYDFMDAGLPTTVVPPGHYESQIKPLLSEIESNDPEVLVVEIGASPLEPYNGAVAIDHLIDNTVFSLMTASDPYAVAGLREAFDVPIDLVSGITTNTEAGIELIRELTELEALNLQEESAKPALVNRLREALE